MTFPPSPVLLASLHFSWDIHWNDVQKVGDGHPDPLSAVFFPTFPRKAVLDISFHLLIKSTLLRLVVHDLLCVHITNMKYSTSLLAAAAVVQASPILQVRQGVTQILTPSAAAPSGCTAVYSGTFGIAAMNISSASSVSKRQVSTLSDG